MLHKKDFLDQLAQLVAIPTITADIDANQKAIEYITSLISPSAHIEVHENNQTKILIASNTTSLNPKIGYLVHVDVVAASEAMFTMQQKENRVFGRGVSDMKFSIPLGIALLNELIDTKSTLPFSLAITTDEEVGGLNGAAHLAHHIGWRPDVLIVPDGGDNAQFVHASKGVAQFEVVATGISAHASRLWEGKNAITPLAHIVTELEKRYKRNNATEGWKTTVNFGKISGGISTNQVCDQATLQLDFRYPETDNFERIVAELQEIAAPFKDQVGISPLATGLPTATSIELPVVKKFLRILEETYSQKVASKPTHGGSDARHFAAYGTPILMIKPHGGDIHMESEWLDVDSTMLFYQALRNFLREMEHEDNNVS